MESFNTVNKILVNLFDEILEYEQQALITEDYKDISYNDMHIIDAIGIDEQQNMTALAKRLKVTVGTLTIAINSLVKKGYVNRIRCEKDKRVVLISLAKKGKQAYLHHEKFHRDMVNTILEPLDEKETIVLVDTLKKIKQLVIKETP